MKRAKWDREKLTEIERKCNSEQRLNIKKNKKRAETDHIMRRADYR